MPDIDEFKCKQCASYFQSHEDMTRHQLTHNSRRTIKCDQCTFIAQDVAGLVKHMRTIHQSEYKKCQYCEHMAQSLELLQTHLIDKHPDAGILHTMATAVFNIDDRIKEFERALKIIIDNQAIVNQEILIVKNQQQKVIESSKKQTYSEGTKKQANNT